VTADRVTDMAGVLVLITGTGRSGTSTMSGTLHHLGLYVPGPYLGSNESNPTGFFESRWAVRFHKRLVERAGIHEFDSRPDAIDRVRAVVDDGDRRKLEAFLTEHLGQSDQVVVKDPRTVWVQRLWEQCAEAQGTSVRFISMLRHPAEVVGSRTTYYSGHEAGRSREADAKRRSYAIFNVARWVNNSLVNERETRGRPRAFVRYTDLLDDWRPVLAGLRDQLGLRYDLDGAGAPAVDDFIDPALRRHKVTWDDLQVPPDLERVAQAVWDALQPLADQGGVAPAASDRLDELATRYAQVLADAAAVDHDGRDEAVALARRRGVAEARDLASQRPEGRPVDAVTARELVAVLTRRAARRLGLPAGSGSRP
jgi:hypothetical protein